VKFTPADGTLVKATGAVSVYPPRGNYQLIAESLIRAGEGDLLAAMEELKRRLAAEGLFDVARKRPLPLHPSRVAVVTSPTGAAVRDILRVLRRRSAGVDVVIVPTTVQGEGADVKIAHGIEAACRLRLGDVIIVGRGGGSLEDLMSFSSEVVVRAIAAATVPVISAVGHETDVTLSDLVADVRAPTPSAAAEMVAAPRDDLAARVAGAADDMTRSVRQRLQRIRLIMEHSSPGILSRSLQAALQSALQRADLAREELSQRMQTSLLRRRHRLELAHRELEATSPLAILGRGYAVVSSERTGKVLVSAEGVREGDSVNIRLARGSLRASVEEADAGEK
jgi:exodeoxyribonuclease VII large subunit